MIGSRPERSDSGGDRPNPPVRPAPAPPATRSSGARGLAKSVYYAGLRGIEFLLHPTRRRRSLAIVSQAAPQRVLFVCHGNICRSPYAAHAVRALLPEELRDQVTLESGGFVGPDRPAPVEALKVAGARGVDLRAHRSKLVTREQIDRADLVVVMDGGQRRQLLREPPGIRAPVVVLGDLDPDRRQPRSIPDPNGMALEGFEHTFDRLDHCLRELAAAIAGSGRNGRATSPVSSAGADEVPFAVQRPAPRKYA